MTLVLFILAQTADLATTLFNLSRGCTELNPVYQGTTLHIVAIKAATTLMILGIVLFTSSRNPRLAQIVLVTAILAATAAATWNLYISPLCGL